MLYPLAYPKVNSLHKEYPYKVCLNMECHNLVWEYHNSSNHFIIKCNNNFQVTCNKTMVITQLLFHKTSSSLISSPINNLLSLTQICPYNNNPNNRCHLINSLNLMLAKHQSFKVNPFSNNNLYNR